MRKALGIMLAGALIGVGTANAQPVDLSAYADANGYIDMQALTCAQLDNTYQEDANLLAAWYSGWYNGLAHKHYLDWKNIRPAEHLMIQRCKEHPEEKIIQSIGFVLQEMRKANGIQ
ncbi:MAG TPA: HdeA/HdeB family chaperone [Roseiarcus sp.]|nr:HdeA/HdeB family chaperone [Roseiarcus sp.]